MNDINLQTKNVVQLFIINPREFSKLSSLDFDFLKDLLIKINTEKDNAVNDKINTITISLELIKAIVINNFPCNVEGLFKFLIGKSLDLIHFKSSRYTVTSLLLKIIEEEFSSNEKYVDNNKNIIKKMNIFLDEENQFDVKDLIKSLRESVLNKELILCIEPHSNIDNKIITNNISISSNMIQEGLLNFQNRAYNSILKMSKSDNSRPYSKLSNGLFIKMITKLYKDSDGGKIISNCLENDFKLSLAIAECTTNNYLMEIIETIKTDDDTKHNFERIDSCLAEIPDILSMIQLIKYCSFDINNLENIMSILGSVIAASYKSLLNNLAKSKHQDTNDELAGNSPLEFLNKFIIETSATFDYLHMHKPLLVFGALNILGFHKFINEATRTCKLEFENLVHNNQDFLFLSRAVLQKLNNLIIFSNKESELNWQGDNDIDITSNLTVLLKSSSRNWLCLILNDKNLQIMLFWLEILHHNAAQTITNLLEQNTLSSPPHVSTTDNILYVDDEDGPGEEYGLNHLFTDYQEKVKPSISNTSSIIRYESRNDNQKLSAQFVNEILKSMSLVVMNEDPVIHKLILQQFDEKALQSVFTLATLIDQEIINMKDSQAPSDLNELTKLFVNFINLLFSSNVINQARSVYFLSLISVQLPKDCQIKECEMPMNLELGPMTILIIMNISIHFTNPGAFQDNSIGWLKSDIYIKLMWKNIFHSIKQSTINNNYKCVDIRQELIQLYLLIFHGLTSISGKTEIVFDLLNCITACSGFKTGVQPRLISRLLIILTYLVHHFYEQSSSLAFQIQYNLLTKYISDSINSDASNYQYDEVQIFDQKTNVIFYDISIPWIASKKFWPGLNPDSLILKNMVNHPQYESFFNGVLDGIQMCLDHRQVYDESQKFSLLSFTGSFYNILLSWRLMEVLPLPDKYQQDIPNIELSCYTRLICSFLKLRNDAKANLLSGKNNLTEELLLIDCQSETKYDLDQHIIHLIANLCERICLDIKNEPAHLPQQIYQIDMIIVSLNFILQCIKDDIDHPSTAEKPSVNTKCYLNSETSENSALSKNLIPIILNIYETLIRQIQLFISRHNCQTGLASLDLLSLTKMSSMELKFDYVNLDLLKSLNVELEKAIDKANWKDIGKESNEITFSHIKQFLASKSFDRKFCIEHDNIIDMIRAESYRRFVFIADHCKFDSSPIGDSVKLILSTTMLAIEDLRETLNLLDNFQMEIPNIPIDSFGKYVDLIVINNINTFVPTTNLPAKSLKSIPNSIYSQVIARKLFSIFFDFHGNTSEANNAGYYDIMNQTIECLINMLDKTIDLSCLSEIVSVFLENASNESHSNIYLIFTLIFNVDRSVPIALKCSLLKLINLIFYRYKNCGKDKQLQDILKKLNYGIHHVTNEQSNTDMIAKIKNWVQELLMNVEVPDENCKSDYLANVLLFSELLALTSYDDEDDRNLCIVICKSILQMDENVRSWLIENRNAFSTSDYSENCQLINLHIIIEMMCVISNGNCSLSVYVNVIQTLLDWNKEINKSLSKYTEHKKSYGPKMELICASLTKIYNHIGAVICALNTNYQSESMKSNLNDILYNMKPSSELYLNDFNMNQLSIDKRAIEEILFCQVKHNPNFGENDLINSESEEEKIMKLNPLDDQLCTFAATQKEFTDQHWYHCHTCSMVENEGVCTICAKVCHLGHDLTYAKRGSFFCDCGAKGSNFCEALTRRTNRTAISKKSQLHASQSTSIDAIKKDKPSMKSQFFEKSKYNFQTRFSKFSSNEKLLRKSYKADTKSRLTAHKMTAAADSGSCPEVTNDDESTSTNMISNAISTVFSVNQSKQVAYRNWITAVLRERILKENETLTILLETSTLLDDCFTALQIIHESFKVQYSDWTVGKNKQMKEAFKSVRTSEKISERVTTIMFTAPSLIGITISDIITKSRQPFNPINSSFNKLSSPTKPKPIVATSRLEQNGFSQLITTQPPEAPGLTTNDALSLVETYLLSELGVTGAQPSIGRGRGLNRRLPIRGIQPPLVSHNQPDSHIANQQNTNMRGTLATDAHKSSVTGKTVSHRLDLGSSIQLRNAEAPSDMSGIPPTSVLASEIAGANSHVRGMLQSGYVRRNVLAVVSSNKGIAGDQYFLAVAQDKSRIMIYKISNLLEELHDGTLIKENNGNMDEESVDLESKQGIIEQVCTTTLPFTVLSMCANPVNQQYMAVCGLKEVSVLIFTSMGSISSKTVVQPILEDSNQFIIYSMWLPGSLNYLVLILTQSVQIFDLSQTTSQPIYHFKSVESRFKDATFAFIPAKTTGSKISTEAKSDCYVLVMSESGCIHCKKLDKTCMASSGFYLAEMLDWNPELYNMNRDLKTGVLGKGGASIHYDHNLQLLFHSYNNGRTFCSVLDSGQDEIYVDKNYYVDIRNEAEFDCTLVNWFSIHDHPGLLMAICQQTNSPVYISVEPEKYCFQILEKSENSENDITDISVASLSKVTDAITFPWRTTLEDKIKVQRTLSMILFNDGRIKILMANIRSPNSDGRFWLQERFTNTFLNECLQGTPSSATPDMTTLELHGIDSNKSSSSKRHINKDEIFLDNSSCGKVPVDFFEHCEQTNEVIFGGDRFLELYSQEVLNLRMLSQDHSVSVACKNPVSLVITNKKPDSVIVGVRIGINVTDPTKIPKYFEIYNRKIPIPEFLNKNRLVDIGLYKSEILNNDKSLHLIIGPSKNSNDIIVIDYVKVFVRLKSSLLWLNEKQEFLRSKESSKTKIQDKSSSNMEGLNKCIGHIITNCKINLSTINPYLPKPELLSSGLQLLTAFFHFKNTLNIEGRPTFSSSEVVTSSVIQTFANDVLSSFYPSTIILNAITLLACVGSIKQIESDLDPSFKKCLLSNVGHKLFSSCSDLIKKLKHEEIDPVNVLLVEATITRLAHLINLHKYWMCIEEENWPQLSYLEIFDLMTTCIELITKYHAVCSSVQPDMGTDSEIVILANFINPVYCQKLDCLPSLIPFIIKGLLNFNFMNTENTSTSSDANHSATVSVQIKLTDLLINMLIDSNLTISHNTRRSLNYFMKLSDKKFIDNNSPEKKIDDVNQTSELKQLKKEPIENSDQNVQEFGQILQSIDTAAINTDDMQTLSILLPDNPEGPSNDNEPDEEEMDDREYFCRAADDEWMVAVSNSESNSLGGSTLANDATNFFQQIDTEAVPTMAEVMQEMIDNADDQRMLDYALRKSLEDQGGSSNDANIEGGAASNISQIFLDSRSLRTDPISSIYTEEDQQSLNNTGTPTIDNWGMNKTNKKNSKQAENLSTPDREYSESNSESDIATYAMLKNASITSKLSPNNSQKVFLVCIQKFGIQFIKRIIVKWSSLMISLQGTRVITLYKSVLDVIRYMDMRDEEARSVVQNLVELMLDLVLGIKKDDDQLTILEYDTNEKRIHCQSICVVLRTLLNFILSGSKIQTIVPPIKEDNNSTAAEGKPTPSSCFNQVFTQDSVAFITLKLAYEKKLISFCLLNLDQLLILWRNQSPDQKNSEKELDTSNKILKQNLTSNQGFDVSVTFDWLPMSDIDSTFDMHLLLTELILRLPYAVLKLCRNTLKEIKVGIERTSDDREIMMELVNSIQKESKWHSVLCEFIEVNISEHITKASRTLLNSVVGAKHYRTVRDIHLIGGSINKIKSLLNKQFSDHNVINRIKLAFDDTLKLLELVDSCINKVKERPSNWKVYCSKCPEILNFLMVNSVSLHETIGLKLLYLLQLALLESESSKLKKETASSNPPAGTSAAVTSVITSSKTADKNTQRKSAGSAPEVNKQEAKLCRALTSKMDNIVLAEFVKVYLCEHEDSGVRWLTEAVLSNLYNHGKAAFRLNLLNTLADCWSFSYISPQLADLIGHLLTKYPNWERIESFSHQLTNDIVQSSQELLSNSCTPFYNCLQRLVKLPGYYLDSEPCSVCLPPSSTNEMHVYRWDSEPTDNRRNQAKSATITGMGLHTASTAISNNDYLTPNVRSNPTVHVFNLRAPYSIQSITVKFTGTRRQRPQCGVTLYYSDISTVSTTQMLDQANLWQKVKTVTVSKDMAEMKLDFPVLLTAVYLIFEYDCFTGSVSNSDNVKCPRCHSASIQGNVCLNCRDNINQCFRCRAINYAGIDSFICANCSSCRYGRIDFSMFAKPCYDFIEELKSEESREVMINRITTWSETVEKNVQEMIILKQELEVFLDQIKMMDAAEMSSQKKVNNSAFITSGTNISGLGTTKLPVSGGKTYAEVTGASAMDDSGLPAKSYRRIRRAAGGENEPEKESTKPPNVNPITTAETVKEEKKDSHSKHIHDALNQLILKYSTDAKEQQLEIGCLWRQLWAAKKAVANYDTRLARAKNNLVNVNESLFESNKIRQNCYACLLSKLQQHIWLMKGLSFIPDIRHTVTNAANLKDMQSLFLGEILNAVSSSMRQEIVILVVQITRDKKEEVIKLNQLITSELLFALRTPYLSAPRESRIKVIISLLKSSIACPDSLWELRLRPAIAVLLEVSNNGPSSENCTKVVVAPCIALIQACMRFLVGKLKQPVLIKKPNLVSENEPAIEHKSSLIFPSMPVLCINQWLQDDSSQLFETWLQCTREENQIPRDITLNSDQGNVGLIQKFASRWFNKVQKKKLSKVKFIKLVNVEDMFVSQAWLWQALLSSSNPSCRQATHLLVEMLGYQSFERHRIVLSVLVQCLPFMVSGIGANVDDLMKMCFPNRQPLRSTQKFQMTNNETSVQYVALLKRLCQEKHWRCYLVIKCRLIEIIDLAMSRVLKFLAQVEESCLDSWRNGQARPGLSNGGWVAINLLKSLAELLLHLQEIPAIAYKYRTTIVKCLLTSSLNMRRLIVFRSKITTDMESRFNKTVDDLSKDSEEIIRSFIKIAVSVLNQFPVTDLQSAGHIIEKINAYICPRDYEHPVFEVVLDIFKGQEDFLPHRMIGVSLSSQSFGHNPTVNDVINFLVRENGVTSDIRLDLICDKKVLMYDLLLEDIYEHVWLCSDSNNKSRPMRLTVRISGLVEDNMPYVESLRKEVPLEHYQRSNELIEGGMHTIIERLAAVDELAHGFSVIASSVRLLNYFIKVPNNDVRLIEPGLDTVKVLLQCLLVCLKGGLDDKRMTEYEESTVVPLINLLCRILTLGRAGSITQQNHMINQVEDMHAIPILLDYIHKNSRVELYQKHITKIPALLAFQFSHEMVLIIDYVVPHFQLLIPNAHIDDNQKQILLCCCNLMSSIPSDEYGTLFRHHMMEKGLLNICIDFLVAVAPEDALKEGLKLDLKRPDTIAFLEQQALQFLLVLGQACVGSNGFVEAGQILLAVPGLLGFLHKLETVKSVQAIGVLSEDWLNALKECSADMNKVISGLRSSTQKNLRAQALKVRQKQLNEMQMTVNDKGQVLTSSSLLKDLSSQVLEEPGHCCDICLDGYVNKPQESLGVYTFVKKVLVHDLMSGKMQALPNSVPCANQYYYTSVSNYVCVHFSCHNQAVKVVNENEWVVAQRHNQNAKCNSLMPILGPHPDNNFKANLNRYQTSIWNNTNVPEINYQLMVHDLKFLLLRFAHNRQFNEDTGGGARLSNIRLVPQIIQIAIANLISQADLINKEMQAMSKWLEQVGSGCKVFNQNLWQATNTPYRIVQFLLFHSRELWLQHRVQILKLLLQFAHMRHLNLADVSQIQPAQLEPLPYSIYHPFLVLFGIIHSFYNILLKNVTSSPGTGKAWMDAVSLYTRENDVALLDDSNKVIRFYEDNLLPCESLSEFWDVIELGYNIPFEEDYLSAVLTELKDVKQ